MYHLYIYLNRVISTNRIHVSKRVLRGELKHRDKNLSMAIPTEKSSSAQGQEKKRKNHIWSFFLYIEQNGSISN